MKYHYNITTLEQSLYMLIPLEIWTGGEIPNSGVIDVITEIQVFLTIRFDGGIADGRQIRAEVSRALTTEHHTTYCNPVFFLTPARNAESKTKSMEMWTAFPSWLVANNHRMDIFIHPV